jgi:hypothetical protein
MPVKFSDEQMLVDMVRENLTQRGEGSFRDTEESLILTRHYLKENKQVVNLFHNLKNGKGKRNDLGENHIDCRTIAKFLSKNGNAVSYHTVSTYLNIHDKLDNSLHKQIEVTKNKGNEIQEEIGVSIAAKLSLLDKQDQKKIWQDIQDNRMNAQDARKYITQYKQDKTVTPEIISQQQYYDNYGEDETIKSINFKKDFEQAKNNYIRDLELWEKYPTKELSKSDKQYYTEIIQDVIKEEQKVIKIMKVKK